MVEESRLRAVVELAQRMAAAHGLSQVALAAAAGAREAMGGSFAAVSVWERERGRLRVLVNVGELADDEEEFPPDESYPVHDFPEVAEYPGGSWPHSAERLGWVETADGFRYGPADWRRRVATAGGERSAVLRRRGRGCCVVAPIVLDGRAWGELYVARRREAPVFGRSDAEFAAELAAVIAAQVVQQEQLEEVRRLAFSDPLTGLANRRAADSWLAEALAEHRRSGQVVGLAVCDLNGLKTVNDTLGHDAGDWLLERFASVLSRCGAKVRGALAARLGGDEFCLLTAGAAPDEVIRAMGEVCRRAAELDPGHGVACGVAFAEGGAGAPWTQSRLFRLADAAQYQAKAARSPQPVVAGRDELSAEVIRLAEAPAAGRSGDRRRFRARGRE